MADTQVIATEQIKERKGFWSKFLTFLGMGGFILIIVGGLAIVIAVHLLIAYLSK